MLISNCLLYKCVTEFIARLIYVDCSKCIYIVKNFLNCSSMLAHTHNLITIEAALLLLMLGATMRSYSGKEFKRRLHVAKVPVSRWTGRMEDRNFWFVSKTGMTKQFTVFIVLIVLCILTRKINENYQVYPYKSYIMIL